MKAWLAVVGMCASLSAAADPPSIKGTFGFDWIDPQKSRCTKVTGALLKKLATAYTCVTPEHPDASASGKRIVATCKAKRGNSEFLLLATAKDCNLERDTQLSNGP